MSHAHLNRALLNMLPQDWRIDRVELGSHIDFDVYEPEPRVWTDGSARPTISAALWYADDQHSLRMPRSSEVSWPATSDKRPDVAQALAVAMLMAAEEARS